MPHLLFAAPSIDSFQLHDRLADLAMRRGHRVSVLSVEPQERAFWAAQGLPLTDLERGGGPVDDRVLPMRELAEVDCALAGRRAPRPRHLRRAVRRLRAHAAAVQAALERDPPDVVLVHARRTGLHRLVHFLARRLGAGVLHLGEGLLPHTLVCDPHGIDGDASLCQRRALDYRDASADRELLHAALAAWLGAAAPPPTLRRPPAPPRFGARLDAAARVGCRRGVRAGLAAWDAWRAAWPPPLLRPPAELALPPLAVVVLLQADADPRVRLDAPPELTGLALLRAAAAAARALDVHAEVVGIEPHAAGAEAPARGHGFRIEGPAAAASALANALAVVTINHPLAGAALLHGTPVVHLGRAYWTVPGTAVAAKLDELQAALVRAVAVERPALRERVLTRLLQRDHVWCSVQRPDRNGLHGIMLRLEQLSAARPTASPIAYRPGPAWPLAAVR